MLVLDAAIDASGQFMLHAAGLTLPGSEAQVLIFAESGTGKTTTSLALADSGFGLCTDNSMVIRLDGSATSGWGLPRDLKVHHNTARMMPWLKPYLNGKWNDEGEQAVTRAALADRIRIETAARRPVAGIFFLQRGEGVKSAAAPLGQTDTLVSLAADNVRTGQTGLLASHRRRFAGLAGLGVFGADVQGDRRLRPAFDRAGDTRCHRPIGILTSSAARDARQKLQTTERLAAYMRSTARRAHGVVDRCLGKPAALTACW